MKFSSAYDYDSKIGSQDFSKMQDDYGYFLDDNGKRTFGIVGQSNAYALIQRDKDNTDWSILKKYLFANDTGKDIGVYGDRSIEPKDIIEAGEFMERMQAKYDNLPQVIKDKYKDLMSFVYGFNEEDFKLFKDTSAVPSSDDIVDKGDGEGEK